MQTIKEICEALMMPEIVTEEVLVLEQQLNFEKLEEILDQLFYEETWKKGLDELREALGNDKQGMKMLTCMMKCGLKTFSMYEALKIPERIFIDSLKCFSRFVREHRESFGIYGFDREWWTVRQLSGKLFRIGELEYELKESRKCDGELTYISLHIPSDANLEPELVHQSYKNAQAFFHQYFPKYEHKEIRCSSWLLSPVLKELLPSTSRIVQFQKDFIIQCIDEESDSFLQWVYKRNDIPLEELPEETTLQKNLKQYLLTGRKVGEGMGYLSLNIY